MANKGSQRDVLYACKNCDVIYRGENDIRPTDCEVCEGSGFKRVPLAVVE